jgi:hypothetical protein
MLAPKQELAGSHAGACWFPCRSMLALMQEYAGPMEEYVYRFLSSRSRLSFYKQSMLDIISNIQEYTGSTHALL